MAKNNNTNYQDMSKDELLKLVVSEKQNYNKLQFNHSVSPLASPIELRNVRRNIARISTALSSK